MDAQIQSAGNILVILPVANLKTVALAAELAITKPDITKKI